MDNINYKTAESKINDYLAKLIYATFKDISLSWNDAPKYNNYIYMSYDQFILDKKNRNEGLKSMFTISTEVRQILYLLLKQYIKECNMINIKSIDNITDLINTFNNEYTESYTSWVLNIAHNAIHFGDTLSGVTDNTNWFNSQITGNLTKHKGQICIIAKFIETWDNFLKAIAWHIGNYIWYDIRPISLNMFNGVLAQKNMPQIMIDELNADIREKPPTKPRVKKVKPEVKPEIKPEVKPKPINIPLPDIFVDDIEEDIIESTDDDED